MPSTQQYEPEPPQSSNTQQYSYFNEGFQDFSALKIRLDTYELHQRIETYLRGQRLVLSYDANGVPNETFESLGKAKANEIGIQTIMAIITGVVNPQTVQGNFDKRDFEDFMFDFHTSLARNIIANCEDWDIEDKDLNPIIDFIVHLVKPFMSRTIDNEERKGYGRSTMMSESIMNKNKARGFRLPSLGR